jgi:hypothetical protein
VTDDDAYQGANPASGAMRPSDLARPQSEEERPAEAPLKVSESHFSEHGKSMEVVVLSDDPREWPKP